MSDGVKFLHALAQALSTLTLYSPEHPATRRASENLWHAVAALLAADPHPIFLFLGTAPVYDGRPLHELRDWQHSQRLAESGVQRLEFDNALTLESLTQLLERLHVRITTGHPSPDEANSPLAGAAFGAVSVQEQATDVPPQEDLPAGGGPVEVALDLSDEIDAVRFVFAEAAAGKVARSEADALTRILAGLCDHHRLPQAVDDGRADRYLALHVVNTALLAMLVAQLAGVDSAGRQRIGVAALLHDVGMALLPAGLDDQETLSDVERARLETHPVLGGRLLLKQGGRGCELAAMVAFEHHRRADGGGFPSTRSRLAPHWVSRLVGCSAAFVAVRLTRSYRPAWPPARALRYIEEGAGIVFDAEIATLLASVVTSA